MPSRTASAGGRGPGRSAGIDRQQIVEAARSLEPEALTMQAVARQLGVDRSAVNYHVKDRESLLELVARDTFAREFARFEFPVGADWRTACHQYTRALRDSLAATGSLVDYIRYDAPGAEVLLQPAELLLEALLAAGFDPDTVSRASLMLANIAMSLARDVVFATSTGGHPQPEIIRHVLDSRAGGFPAMRAVMALGNDPYADAQLAFCVDVFCEGLDALRRQPASR